MQSDQSRFLFNFSDDTVLARHEWASWLRVRYQWLADNQHLILQMEPQAEGPGVFPLQDLYLVDTQTGTLELLMPASEAYQFQLNSEQTKLYAVEPGILHSVNLLARTHEAIQLPIRDYYTPYLQQSPDGKTLLLSGPDNLLIYDLHSRQLQLIDIYFPSIGMGHGSVYPPTFWSSDNQLLHLLIPVASGIHLSNNEVWEPDAQFTYFRLDMGSYELSEIATLRGNLILTHPSPDGTHFAWELLDQEFNGGLAIYDVRTDSYRTYEEHSGSRFAGWAPDSHRFAYQTFHSREMYIGRLCDSPQRVNAERSQQELIWIDGSRYLVRTCPDGWTNCALDLYFISHPDLPQRLNIPEFSSNQPIDYVTIRSANE